MSFWLEIISRITKIFATVLRRKDGGEGSYDSFWDEYNTFRVLDRSMQHTEEPGIIELFQLADTALQDKSLDKQQTIKCETFNNSAIASLLLPRPTLSLLLFS